MTILILDHIHDLSRNIALTTAMFPWSVTMVDADVKVAPPFDAIVEAVRELGGECDPMRLIHHLEAKRPSGDKWRSLLLSGDAYGGTHVDLAARVSELRRLNACATAYTALQAAQMSAGQGDSLEAENGARAAAQALAGWVGESTDTASADQVMVEFAKELDGESEPAAYVRTGFDAFDRTAGTICAEGRLVVLAARPGQGKTALALNVSGYVSQSDDAFVWCGEMNKRELFCRMLADRAEIPVGYILENRVVPSLHGRLRAAMGDIANLRLSVNTAAGMTVPKFDAIIRSRIAANRKPRLVVVDYLQRMKSANSRSREEEVGGIARDLKELAKTHSVCVLALAQMNREVEKRADPRPKLSDLRDSGQIEQEADAILFPYRDPLLEPDGTGTVPATLYLEKFRHGMSGVPIPLRWHGPFQRWSDG